MKNPSGGYSYLSLAAISSKIRLMEKSEEATSKLYKTSYSEIDKKEQTDVSINDYKGLPYTISAITNTQFLKVWWSYNVSNMYVIKSKNLP